MDYSTIYQKIKQLRLKRKITIQDLSTKTGLTPGYLSKSEAEHDPSLIRQHERKEIIGDYTHLGYRYQAIIKNRANGTIKPFIIDLPGNSDPAKIPYNYHDGEEMIYVLQGKMTFYYGDEQYPVEEGDCLNFNPTVPHKVVAADENQTVKILSVLSL